MIQAPNPARGGPSKRPTIIYLLHMWYPSGLIERPFFPKTKEALRNAMADAILESTWPIQVIANQSSMIISFHIQAQEGRAAIADVPTCVQFELRAAHQLYIVGNEWASEPDGLDQFV